MSHQNLDSSSFDIWFLVIVLLGISQGIFLAAILFSRKGRSQANFMLGGLMVVFALDLAAAAYQSAGFHKTMPYFLGLDYPLAFLYGPFLYLYTRLSTRADGRLKKQDVLHFLLFALTCFLLLPFATLDFEAKQTLLESSNSDLWMQALGMINHIRVIHAFIYLVFSYLLLRAYRRSIKDDFSSLERINLTWLRNFLVCMILLAGISIGFYIFSLQTPSPVIGLDPGSRTDDLTLLTVALMVYALGFMGLRQPEVFSPEWQQKRRASKGGESSLQPAMPYAKSGMSEEEAREIQERLSSLMNQDRFYRRPNLTLLDLSNELEVSTHKLTEVINTGIGVNFYDFINGLRVEEIKTRLQDPKEDHLTLLAIGLEAGFNSKSSFNSVFKKHTGLTPSQFKARFRE